VCWCRCLIAVCPWVVSMCHPTSDATAFVWRTPRQTLSTCTARTTGRSARLSFFLGATPLSHWHAGLIPCASRAREWMLVCALLCCVFLIAISALRATHTCPVTASLVAAAYFFQSVSCSCCCAGNVVVSACFVRSSCALVAAVKLTCPNHLPLPPCVQVLPAVRCAAPAGGL
jgi:hypothetical protein